MVVQWFIHQATSLITWALTLLPSWSAPSFLTDLNNALTTIGNDLSSTSVWFPWSAIAIALSLLMAAATAALLIKAVRITISHFTGGGGSAS